VLSTGSTASTLAHAARRRLFQRRAYDPLYATANLLVSFFPRDKQVLGR
jgi:hypothetical protein